MAQLELHLVIPLLMHKGEAFQEEEEAEAFLMILAFRQQGVLEGLVLEVEDLAPQTLQYSQGMAATVALVAAVAGVVRTPELEEQELGGLGVILAAVAELEMV